MFIQVLALAILGLVFLIATWKPVHLGLLALVAAFGVGLFIAEEPLADILDAFPVGLLVLLVGVTYLFSIARESGVVDWVIHRAIRLIGGNLALLPWVFFVLCVVIASMGSPLACVAVAPIAMFFVTKHQINPTLMALPVVVGGVAGGFAPISLFGVITNGISANSGLEANPIYLFVAAIVFNTVAMAVAFLIFGGPALVRRGRESLDIAQASQISTRGPGAISRGQQATREMLRPGGGAARISTAVEPDDLGDTGNAHLEASDKLTVFQAISLASISVLLVLVVVLSALKIQTDVGVIALTLAVLISLLYPERTKPAMKGIDWSTVLLVGGVITYAGVLQRIGAIDMLGDAAAGVPHPILAALLICVIGAFVSAFASTTGILGALIPLSIPLMATGNFTGYGLIVALAISSSLVDATPFSTAGAACVGGAPEDVRPGLTRNLMRWGLSMIIIGPLATTAVLVLPGMLL
ncbi:C4-dicarboxylate ABC transporter (plasmid) [Rhodococcus sp. USK10]|uniref:SLC13 family permease n=1 Tax=Rhodococcus sp. USK10 TaxID=2789739 RepID=UPI001C5E1388|nr:SLC13 family permease [Rhodococcus sp. USK10]QYB00332.1 C4-dicarboxylate ABC transporter [Rhodococcus sp. USK10]